MQEARNHHFVPKFLLRPWLKEGPSGQPNLWGYYWNDKHRELACKQKGLNSFCCQIDLLTLKSHRLGRDAIERIFFGQVDTKGSIARNALLENGPNSLNAEKRLDFARLIISLEARRPSSVEMLRTNAQLMMNLFDSNLDILKELVRQGIYEMPSAYFERTQGSTFEDRILILVQTLTDSPKAYGPLIDSHWHLLKFGHSDGSLVLSDRPLIRAGSIQASSGVWILPLTPKVAFLASKNRESLSHLEQLSRFQLCREINIQSALQAERFVFSIDAQASTWLGKYLGPRKGK